MKKINILNEFQEIQNITTESNLAYAFRIKIFRKVIILLSNVSKHLNFPDVERLAEINKDDQDPHLHALCSAYNYLVKTTTSLSQPSEPLNNNWNIKWENFLLSLKDLEKEFKSI